MADAHDHGHDDVDGAIHRTFTVTFIGGVLFVAAFFFVLL